MDLVGDIERQVVEWRVQSTSQFLFFLASACDLMREKLSSPIPLEGAGPFMERPQRVSIGAIERACPSRRTCTSPTLSSTCRCLDTEGWLSSERHGDVADGALFGTEIIQNLATPRFGDRVERIGGCRSARHESNHIPIWEYVKPMRCPPALDFAWREQGRVSEVSDCSGRRLCVGGSRLAVAPRAVAVLSDCRMSRAAPTASRTSPRRHRAPPMASPTSPGIWNYAGVLGFRGGPPPSPPGTPVAGDVLEHRSRDQGRPAVPPVGRRVGKQRMAVESKDNPDAACLPLGHMQLHTHSQPRKMIQTKDLIVIIYEANAGVRQIFLDGRPAPNTTRNRGGSDTHADGGKTTRWSSKRLTSVITAGST